MRNFCLTYSLALLLVLSCSTRLTAANYSISEADELDFNTLPTAFGVFGTTIPDVISYFGGRATRIILWDLDISEVNMLSFAEVLQELHGVGVDQIVVTLRWPVDDNENSFHDRIPEDFEAALADITIFLEATEGLVDWVQIQNEPFGGPGVYQPTEEKSTLEVMTDAFVWWEAVANHIRAYNTANNTTIGIIGPAMTGFGFVLDGGNGEFIARAVHESFVNFAENFCDALDMHLHMTDMDRLTATLDYIDTLDPQVPKFALEWSQAKAVKDYVAEPDNATFLDDIYAGTPVTIEQWQAFVKAAPLDSLFIPNAMRLLQERDFLAACYGSALQHSKTTKDRHYDVTALISQIATGAINPSQPVSDQFRALSTSIQSEKSLITVTSLEPGLTNNTIVHLSISVMPATTYQLYFSVGDFNSWAALGDEFSSTSANDATIKVTLDTQFGTPCFFKVELANPVRNLEANTP